MHNPTRVINRIFQFLVICCLFSGGASAQESSIFPIFVEHALGKTRIEARPERIVTIGWSGEDAVLALGLVPVGMTEYKFFPSGMFPWNETAVGDAKPILLSDAVIDFEAVAALRPDVILGIYSGVDDVSYKRLSAIAPTVVYRSGPWQADWMEQTYLTGEALGKRQEAQKLINDTIAELRALGTSHPALVSKTFIFGSYFPGGNGIVVYLPKDPRVAALVELGMVVPPYVADLASQNPTELSVFVSFEEMEKLAPDLVVMWYKPGAREALEKQPLFTSLDAFQSGRYVPLEDAVSIWATSALSVRSIPYFYPHFIGQLADAAAH
ncbi:iron-siderophore ABC transporter substrate-binding protein [Agrobacterium sp. DKPNP3]|uniref:iron-siderophore ABC transporter substrate-binding protein n=1 Tax=Agrobacterium sp. DKPNP3 TaxID=3457323 RepID=UPI004043E3C5